VSRNTVDHERDFYAWTVEQARLAARRRCFRHRREKGNFHSAGVRLAAYLVKIDLRQPPRRETSRAPNT